MPTLLQKWYTEHEEGTRIVRGLLLEVETQRGSSLKIEYQLYVSTHRKNGHSIPFGVPDRCYWNINSAKQFFKRNYGINLKVKWRNIKLA